MNLMQKLLIGTGLIGSLSLGCKGSESTGPKENPPEQTIKYKYMFFSVTHGNPPRGGFFDVGIYNQNTRVRWELGSTLLNGNYVTGRKLDASTKWRAEIYTHPDHVCVMAFWDISQNTTPWLWTDNQSETPIAGTYLGAPPTPASGCWGF
ncbi:MAG: hypothetical protein Q8P79_03155 [Nanoarchaeota archaeon]|nr:hypothetical protein [Nanoarchaeota archaeon]